MAELSAQLLECHGLPTLGLVAPFFDGGQGFVDRDEHGSGTATPGDDDVLSEVGHLIYDLAEPATKLTDRDGLANDPKCALLRTQLLSLPVRPARHDAASLELARLS